MNDAAFKQALKFSGYVLIVWFMIGTGAYFWSGWWSDSGDRNWAIAGQIGDSFGAINSLFSAGAFVVIMFTLFTQHRQIQDQEKQFAKEVELATKQTDLVAKQ